MMAAARGFAGMARAKFNVRLEVGAQRPDGFHGLRSVIADLALADGIEFGAGREFQVECDDPSISRENNLAFVAARNLAADLPAMRIYIRKRIPQQAGLGGGSADAAATLRGIAAASAEIGRPISEQALFDAAIKTGSDVPACLVAGFKRVEGRGEIVRPLGIRPPPWGLLLLKPAGGIDTTSGYRALDQSRTDSMADAHHSKAIERLIAALESHDFAATCALAHNDFQAPIEAAYPMVADVRRRLDAAGSAATVLCGSGSCVAGWFPSVDDARSAAVRLSLADGEWSCATGFA
jgi:4-diphosphocytidyl-2-C-methyl-D-erythritol kinase